MKKIVMLIAVCAAGAYALASTQAPCCGVPAAPCDTPVVPCDTVVPCVIDSLQCPVAPLCADSCLAVPAGKQLQPNVAKKAQKVKAAAKTQAKPDAATGATVKQ